MAVFDSAFALPVEVVYGLLLLLGLCVGSFLNLVSLRLPIMLMARWQAEADNAQALDESLPEPPFNLVRPRSHCPHCRVSLGILDMIPVFSYLLLRGRCRHCRAPISMQYPLIEAAAAFVTLLSFWWMDEPLTAAATVVAGWLLLVLSIIDFRRLWLPDVLTYTLLWLGLLLNCFSLFVPPDQAIFGAVAGYALLWLPGFVFRYLTGKEGIGQGDFKLLACAGAWLGPFALPKLLLVAALCGLIFALGLRLSGKWQSGSAISFGPWLGLSFWLSLLYGDAYLRLLF